MVNLSETLNDMIADPFDGPFEGEDFWVTEDGIIQVNNNDVGLAGKIMRKINQSGNFDKPLIKLGTSGDSIQLSFDTLGDTTPIFSAKIGFKGIFYLTQRSNTFSLAASLLELYHPS